jgi:3',5'-cyclic AMP phosphodiesterase CpdA
MFGSGALGEWKRAFSTSVAGEEDDSGSARYYAIDAGNVRIVVLDFNQMSPAQTSWLDKTLAGARAAGAEHLFVAIHHGPYDSGDHGENRDARARWLPIFARHGVELIFSGHDHDYERGQGPEGIRYVVSGGGGAPLYDGNSHRPYQQVFESTLHYVLVDVAGSKVTLTARRPDGTVVDSFFFYSGEKAPTAAMGPQEPGAKSPGVEKQPVSAMASAETPGPTGCHCRAAGRAAGRPGSPPAGPFLVGMGLAAALLRRRRE